MSGFTIGVGYLPENSTHNKIRERFLGSVGVGSCPGLKNRCTFGLANQHNGSYSPATKLELIRFRTFPFRELVWHLSTQVNYGNIAAYITVFELRRGNCRRFIPFLFYTLVYPSICIILDTLSPWSESVCTHICSSFLMKPLFGQYRTVKTGLLLNWELALNSFGS